MKMVHPAWLALVLALACGGEVGPSGSGGGSNVGGSSGSSSGGAGTGAGSSGSAGLSGGAVAVGGGDGACDASSVPVFRPACGRDCSTDPDDQLSFECTDGSWQCASPLMSLSSCALGTCARRYEQDCCDDATGQRTNPACGADGLSHCAPPFRIGAAYALCKPDTVMTPACGSLQQTPCASSDYECHQGRPCGGTNCKCVAVGSGSLIWDCTTTPC